MMAISSCMTHDMTHVMLNMDYPAAYVVNGASNTLSVIKLSDNSVTETIALNGATFPHHIYLNPAKTKLAIAITSTDLSGGHAAGHNGSTAGLKVQIIDAISGMVDKEIALSKMPHNAIFNRTGSELWIGQMDLNQSQILVYKTSDWSLQNTINVGKGLSEVTFSGDGNRAFACNTVEGTVSIIDANTKKTLNTLTVGADPVGAWGAGNGNVYVDNEKSQTISVISEAGLNVSSTINVGFKPAYAAYSTHHSELWVSDATAGKVHRYKKTGNMWATTGNIVTGADAHAIAFSANGQVAYVTNQGANTVSVINVPNLTVTKTIPVGAKPNGIAIKQ